MLFTAYRSSPGEGTVTKGRSKKGKSQKVPASEPLDLSRRDFLRLLGSAGVGSLVALSAGRPLRLFAQEAGQVPVALVAVAAGATARELEEAIQRAVLASDSLGWLEPGQTVLLKVASDTASPHPHSTHPAAIRAVGRLLKDHKAGKILVGDQGGLGEGIFHSAGFEMGRTGAFFEANGISQAARDIGARLVAFEKRAFVRVKPNGLKLWKDGFRVPKLLGEVDHIVSLPRVSSHVLTGESSALENAVGFLSTADRLELYTDRKNLHARIAELQFALSPKLRLHVLAAVEKVPATGGPGWGHLQELGGSLVVSTPQVVAADAMGLALLKLARSKTPWAEKRFDYRENPLELDSRPTRTLILESLTPGHGWSFPSTKAAQEAGFGFDSRKLAYRTEALSGTVFEEIPKLLPVPRGIVDILDDILKQR